jgi:hypothetical protein
MAAGDDRSGLEDDPEKTVLQMKVNSKKHPCSRKDGMFTASNSGRLCVVLRRAAGLEDSLNEAQFGERRWLFSSRHNRSRNGTQSVKR